MLIKSIRNPIFHAVLKKTDKLLYEYFLNPSILPTQRSELLKQAASLSQTIEELTTKIPSSSTELSIIRLYQCLAEFIASDNLNFPLEKEKIVFTSYFFVIILNLSISVYLHQEIKLQSFLELVSAKEKIVAFMVKGIHALSSATVPIPLFYRSLFQRIHVDLLKTNCEADIQYIFKQLPTELDSQLIYNHSNLLQKCGICLNPMYLGISSSDLQKIKCNHYFHTQCIQTLRNTSRFDHPTCPLCRTPLSNEDLSIHQFKTSPRQNDSQVNWSLTLAIISQGMAWSFGSFVEQQFSL